MSKPSSFATICTLNCAFELVGLVLSLSLFHKNEKIYIMCDSKTKEIIDKLTPKPKLQILWYIELDKYDGMNREIMEKKGLWSEFQMSKANIIKKALEYEKDTLFLDSDIIITNTIDDIDITKTIGVSPGFIAQKNIDEVGYYNGGMLWTNNINVANDWIIFTKTSRYFDQASIEDLVKKYSYFEFGENYNLQCWRYYLSPDGKDKISSYISSTSYESNIYYKNKPLKFIHTHFLNKRFYEFNNILINHLKNAKMYKILAIIFRVINNKWTLRIPKQPLPGVAFHTNDSYRELAVLLKVKNDDVELIYDSKTIHCWLEPNLLTYDRPTLEFCNNELNDASILLLGNGDINVEGKYLITKFLNLKITPWIFWPRKPIILEKILKDKNVLSFEDRNIESIFIGNFENKVQEQHRKNNNIRWENVISEYHCTKGKLHKFTHEEYLLKLRQSKYGLCLRGYGSKCHREVELMAFGTVPIVTPEVSITSYMNPLIENIHYLYVKSPNELKEKLSTISIEKWKEMSSACYEWYQSNIHSNNCWNNMISNILYK
jgi:hypothetical protein